MPRASSRLCQHNFQKRRLNKRMSETAIAHTGKNAIKDGWFSEISEEMWPGQANSLEIEKCVFDEQSKFQHVQVFRTRTYGNLLVLDGCIQATERDEFAYSEMIAHLPLCAIVNEPRRVLIIGGGDGGALRECMRHETVELVEMAEIDEMVPEVSKKFMEDMAIGFDDPRAKLRICDGVKFVEESEENTYDCVIVDSSDPIGPASVLFEERFFRSVYRVLKPGGVVCTQGECVWLHGDLIGDTLEMCKRVFENGSVSYAYCTIPTYPSGQIGFVLASKPNLDESTVEFSKPSRKAPMTENNNNNSKESSKSLKPLRYYNSEIHSAAFCLPTFAKEFVDPHLIPGRRRSPTWASEGVRKHAKW